MKREVTLAYLERKAKNARDFPSFLSGLCPDGHKTRKQGERDSILRQAFWAWNQIRGTVFGEKAQTCFRRGKCKQPRNHNGPCDDWKRRDALGATE